MDLPMLKDILAAPALADLVPHGTCLLWRPNLLLLHALSDGLISAAYYSIPAALIYFVGKRHDLRFRWIFVLFGLFILACGTTHLMEIWTLWHPDYIVAGFIKLFTAVVSVGTAIALWPLIPHALALPSPAELTKTNTHLQREIEDRRQSEQRIKELNDELERRVEERTAQLLETNHRLEAEIRERRRAEQSLRESEIRYRTLFEQMPDAVLLVDSVTGDVLDFNEKAHQNLGYTHEEFGKLRICDIDRRESEYEFMRHIAKIRAAGGDLFETEHTARNGAVHNIRVNAKVIHLNNNEFIQAILTDVSAYKRLELALRSQQQKLRQSQTRLEYILNTSPSAVYILALTGHSAAPFRLSFIGASITPITGYEPADWYVQETFWIEHVHPDDRAFVLKNRNALLEENELTQEYRFRHKDGSYRWVHDKMYLARDTSGKAIEAIGAWIDITESHQAELALAEAKEAAEAANRAKTEFLANISHELRTPMNAILGFTQILQREPDLNSKHRDFLNSIRRSGSHLLTLIDDLLDLSKIESGKLDIARSIFGLAEFLDGIAEIFVLRARQKGLVFRFEKADPLPDFVFGDEKRLRQVLINLLSNAVKFTAEGQAVFRVSHRDNTACFEIEDTGPGIAERDLERIFAPFERLEYHASGEGSGLGLAITKRLAELMQGKLEVHSIPGKGSLFRIGIPLPIASKPSALKSRKQHIVGYQGERRRIMIVDDNPDNLAILASVLEPMGFVTESAINGREALEKFEDFDPALMLVDLVMPEMDGTETVQRLRTGERGRAVKAIAVTANAFEDTRQMCLASGFDDFIAKPLEIDDLFDLIQAHLGVAWRYRGDDDDGGAETGARTARPLDALP
jgi:PAS domain S-box-containing protein